MKKQYPQTEAGELGARKENAQWRVEDTRACSAHQLGPGIVHKEKPLTKRADAQERRYEVATQRVCSLSHGKK